jgi:hypothetical protein
LNFSQDGENKEEISFGGFLPIKKYFGITGIFKNIKIS